MVMNDFGFLLVASLASFAGLVSLFGFGSNVGFFVGFSVEGFAIDLLVHFLSVSTRHGVKFSPPRSGS